MLPNSLNACHRVENPHPSIDSYKEARKLKTAGFEYVCHHEGKSHLGSLSKDDNPRKQNNNDFP